MIYKVIEAFEEQFKDHPVVEQTTSELCKGKNLLIMKSLRINYYPIHKKMKTWLMRIIQEKENYWGISFNLIKVTKKSPKKREETQ